MVNLIDKQGYFLLSIRHVCFEPIDLCFEFADAMLVTLDHWDERLLCVARFDVLRAVDVPRFDMEDDRPPNLASVSFIIQTDQQCGVIFPVFSTALEFYPTAVDVLHQEDKGLLVLIEVADGDVLYVAREVRKL